MSGAYFANLERVEPSIAARDRDAAARLWSVCAQPAGGPAVTRDVGYAPGHLGGRIPPSWRALLLFIVAMLPLAAGVFLLDSAFFAQWSGLVVSARPLASPDAAVQTVLIVAADGGRVERAFPSELVRELVIPVDPLALPPKPLPTDRPRSEKHRFALQFQVRERGEDSPWRVLPTTSPRGLGLAVAFMMLAVGIRNMMYAGSPFSIERAGAFLPRAQAQAGQPAPRGSPGRPKGSNKGPPPARPRRGRGRR